MINYNGELYSTKTSDDAIVLLETMLEDGKTIEDFKQLIYDNTTFEEMCETMCDTIRSDYYEFYLDVILEPTLKLLKDNGYRAKKETNNFEVVIIDDENGYFEHLRLGDEIGGTLRFENDELVEFDGTSVLPSEVCKAINDLGLVCNALEFCE